MLSTRCSCQILNKLEWFHENPSSWSWVAPFGRTDGRKEGRTDGQMYRQTWRSWL